jgi:hypothetical protein
MTHLHVHHHRRFGLVDIVLWIGAMWLLWGLVVLVFTFPWLLILGAVWLAAVVGILRWIHLHPPYIPQAHEVYPNVVPLNRQDAAER